MSARAESLAKLITAYGVGRMAELGVFKGDTLFRLLDAFPRLFVMGVDAWVPILGPKQDRQTGQASYEAHDLPMIGRIVTKRAEKYGVQRCMIIQHDTADAAKYVPDGFMDLVFIDADHSTEGVLRDIRAWLPKVKRNGIICGHDINWPSVENAVKHSFSAFGVMPGNMWWKFNR